MMNEKSIQTINNYSNEESEPFNNLDDVNTSPWTNDQGNLKDYIFDVLQNIEVINNIPSSPPLQENVEPQKTPKEDMIINLGEFDSNRYRSKKKQIKESQNCENVESNLLSFKNPEKIKSSYHNSATRGKNENLGIKKFTKFKPHYKKIPDENFQFQTTININAENQTRIKRKILLFNSKGFSRRKKKRGEKDKY